MTRKLDYLIVGGGLTGAAAAREIRAVDGDGSVLIVGREGHPPYHRPPLTKKLWFGGQEVKDIFYEKGDFYRTNRIDFVTSRAIARIVPGDHRAEDDRGDSYEYRRLLLATGGRPRTLAIPGGDIEEIVYFRTLDDYERLRARATKGRRATVIGGGYIGTEIAAALSHAGTVVTMIFPGGWFCDRLLPESLGRALVEKYVAKGITILTGDRPARMRRTNGAFAVETERGNEIASDLIVAGLGIVPSDELARSAGLATNDGVVVDTHLRTSDPSIWAAGDVASFPYVALGVQRRIEHWDNALKMGACAGRNMAGRAEPYDYMPFFFSDLFDFGYEAVGEISSKLETFADWKTENEKGVIYYIEGDRVRGVLLANTWDKVDDARKLILRGETIGRREDLRGRIG